MSRTSAATPGTFRIFFACPISAHIDRATSRLDPAYERFIRAVHAALSQLGDVFLALEREQWGRALMAPEVCAPLDFAEMQRCDVVVAYPGTSCGVAVELGWASALHRPIVLLIDDTTSESPLIRGIGALPQARVRTIALASSAAPASLDRLQSELVAALRDLRGERDDAQCFTGHDLPRDDRSSAAPETPERQDRALRAESAA